MSELSIGITTCGRPKAVKKCLQSIKEYVSLDCEVIVLDSLITDTNRKIYKEFPEVKLIEFEDLKSPSEARKIISENFNGNFLLYLDDDIEVNNGSVEKMYNFIKKKEKIDIVGGVLKERGGYRYAGQFFEFGYKNGMQTIFKRFMTVEEARKLGLDYIFFDSALSTMMIRKSILKNVQFDPQFKFYYELFDFFMQCYSNKIKVATVIDAVFDHNPQKYESSTYRQKSDLDIDKNRFIEKWGYEPVGQLGGGTFTENAFTKIKNKIYNKVYKKYLKKYVD